MSKDATPLFVGDISPFARSLRRSLEGLEHIPGHVEMLNLLAKAGGFRNFQHLKAQHQAHMSLDEPKQPRAEVNYKLVKRLVRFFDQEKRLVRWPKKFSERLVCLWVMWSRLPARTTLTEREISERLESWHLFGDYALLRRELVDRGMVERTPDGRQYKRLETEPPPEAVALLEHLRKQ